MSGWPEPVERVAAALRNAGAETNIEILETSTVTAKGAAAVLGVSVAQIVKTVLFFCDEMPAIVLAPSTRRVSLEKVARATESELVSLASAAEVIAVTGVEPGSVSPFPPPRGVRVFMDSALMVERRIWVGAGSPSHLLACAPRDLITLSGAEVLDVVDAGG